MIVAKPKFNTSFALGIFLILIFAAFFMLLNSLLSASGYFIIKLILTPAVLVIGLLVMNKFLNGLKHVKFGKDKIEIFYLVTRQRKVILLKDVLGWRQESVNMKGGAFSEVKILYDQKKILKLSNKENTEYDKVVAYLKKKVKVAK